MANEKEMIFTRNVSHGVGKVHTHYLKGHLCPKELCKELAEYLTDAKPVEAPKAPPAQTQRQVKPKDEA